MVTPPPASGPVFDLTAFDPATVRGMPGFFRVGRTRAGQWWLIDPDDRPFFSKGVTSINRAGTAGGRYAKPGPYAEAVERLHGPDPQVFVRSVIGRLRAWNCNTLGSWTTEEFFDRGMPYTEIIEFTKSGAPLLENPQRPEKPFRMVDVFDPQWPVAADAQARQLAAPRRASRELIGYYTDNEVGFLDPKDIGLWGQTTVETGSRKPDAPSLLQVCLSQAPGRPAAEAAWAHALAPHGGDLAALGRAWGIDLPDRTAVRALTAAGTPILSPAYLLDCDVFVRDFARRYFATVAAAIRRHDPNHLILGIRFGGPPGRPVMDSCVAPWVDVLSANNYQEIMAERMDLYWKANGMPILIGEFAWASDYFRKLHYAREPVGLDEVERMQRKGRACLERTCAHPAVVGYTWYRWVQGDGANPQPGYHSLVHADDSTNRFHVPLLTQVNARAERIRRGELAPYDPLTDGPALVAEGA